MAWPFVTASGDGNAQAAFVSAAQASGLPVQSLGSLAQVQLALANLLVGDPSTVVVPATDIIGASGVFQFGTPTNALTSLLLGSGATAVTPAAIKIGFTNGTGANNAAGALTIVAPLSTSNGAVASIIFQNGLLLTTGSVLQTATTNLTLSSTGAAGSQVPLATFAGNLTVSGLLNSTLATGPMFIAGGVTNGAGYNFAWGVANGNGLLVSRAGADNSGSVKVFRLLREDGVGATIDLYSADGATITTTLAGGTGASEIGGALGVTGLTTLGASAGTAGVVIDGTGFGAGVASLRMNGLTTAATTNLVGTLTNSPVTGNPNFWMPISIAGTIRYIPCF